VVFAEVIAGISLVNSAADQIKKVITHANDVSKIAKHIDDMFEGQSQINKKRSEYSQSTFSVHKVAEETINAKLAQEQLNEMAQLIDLRFGHGTWSGIIAERAKRIQEAKEHQARLRREARLKKEELLNALGIAIGIIIGAVGIIFGTYIYVNR